MAWDSTRPVPWQRLIREWLIYVAIMGVLFLVFLNDSNPIGIIAGLFMSGPLYLFFGSVMAKFGYQRRTLRELRDEPRTDTRSKKRSSDADDDDRPRPKPAPTKRTGGGGRPGGQRSKRRR